MKSKIELRKTKLRIKATNSILKSISKWHEHFRCIFSFNEFFLVTDNYQAYFLKEDIPDLPHYQHKNHPRLDQVEKVFNTTMEVINDPDITLSIDTEVIEKAIKQKQKIVNIAGHYFNPRFIRNMIHVLDTSMNIKMKVKGNPNTDFASAIIAAESIHGYGIIYPIRVFDYQKSKYKIASKDEMNHRKE